MFFSLAESIKSDVNNLKYILNELKDIVIFIDYYYPGLDIPKNIENQLTIIENNNLLINYEIKLPYLQFLISKIKNNLVVILDRIESNNFKYDLHEVRSIEILLIDIHEILTSANLSNAQLINYKNKISIILDWSSSCSHDLIHENFGADCIYNSEFPKNKWIKAINGAFRIIEKHLPEILPIINNNLHVIIPLKAREANISLSSTPNYTQGLMLTSLVSSKLMAESIIHETSHDILNKYSLQYCLFNNDVPKYYSPFRSDTRPASGLLHAAYSFCNVLQFYEKISKEEARLAQWAQLSIERYYFNVLLCLELLEKGNDLSARGMNLVHEMQKWITIFSSTQNIKVRKNVIDEKNQHFNDWLTSNQEIGVNIANIYSNFITNKLTTYLDNIDDDINYEFKINEMSLDNFVDTYKLGNTPIIIRSNSLVNQDEFIKSIEDSKHARIQLLESKKHKGFSDTPSIKSSLESHISSFKSDFNSHQYFSVIRDFSSITKRNIWKNHHFFDDFWIDEGETWIFINSKGLQVPLHNDSVNNLHCVITGSKTFYLSPPSEAFILTTSISDYNLGFSDYNPFLNKNKSIQYGQFIRLYEGDMLFLPNGWWHSIYYDEDTMAASAFDEFVI